MMMSIVILLLGDLLVVLTDAAPDDFLGDRGAVVRSDGIVC